MGRGRGRGSSVHQSSAMIHRGHAPWFCAIEGSTAIMMRLEAGMIPERADGHFHHVSSFEFRVSSFAFRAQQEVGRMYRGKGGGGQKMSDCM